MPVAGLNRWLKIMSHVFRGIVLFSSFSACAVPLLRAASSGDTARIRQLLEDGHNANEAFPIVGTRPLILASSSGHVETVAALLDAGADIDAQDLTGWTALHAAAFNGDSATISLLLQRGALFREPRWYRKSPTDIAEMLGHTNIVSVLQKAQRLQRNQP
ncbi:ankyrin repeat domain-containing protein [Nitrospira sp. Nam74]